MARVHILATGGTIAGQGATDTSSAYRPGSVMIEHLIDSVPGLGTLAEVTGEQFAQISSQDMNELLWRGLANRINELFEGDAADGVVVTHGTDTAEETGYFLHLTVTSARPVVLTGSMRPATSLSADGPLNLYNAVSVAADRDACDRGVMLAINDDLHSARDVTKSSTTDVQTFISCLGRRAWGAFVTSVGRCDGTRPSRAFQRMASVACPEWMSCSLTPACMPIWCVRVWRSAREASSSPASATATCQGPW
jgi:L-asparaginase type II